MTRSMTMTAAAIAFAAWSVSACTSGFNGSAQGYGASSQPASAAGPEIAADGSSLSLAPIDFQDPESYGGRE